MTNRRPRRARAAAATLTAIALAGFASVADASIENLVGVDRVAFAWQPATGQPISYLVSRSRNGGPLQTYGVTLSNSIVIPAAPGDQIRISVRATGVDGTGAVRVGPASPLSDPVTVLPAPVLAGEGQWLLRCASCPAVESRWVSDASEVAAGAVGLRNPWVVLGRAGLDDGAETIVWHNTQTGELALWDSASLTPIPGATAGSSTAMRGIGATDLDRNGTEEFLTQRTDTLEVSVWELTANGLRRVARLSGPPGAHLAAARDFNRDGRVDLLWHDPISGVLDLARFSSTPNLGTAGTIVSLVTPIVTRLSVALSSNVQVASTGDYDDDRSPDLLFRYPNGSLAILYLNRGAADGFVWLPSAPDDVDRVVVGSPDADDGNGDEIALQHRPTGEISIVNPTVTGQPARTVVLSAGSKWEAVGVGS